ncbi:MAG TPA: hypothetical protein DDZ76_05050 [Xanthomonadales bacterium]|nr:hypothetical protein [Xanthomonadales bacterium]
MPCPTPADRRSFLLSGLCYLGSVYLAAWLLEQPLAEAHMALRVAVALLPVPAIVWLIRIVVRGVLARDEMQRRIDLEAIAISSLAIGLAALTLSLLAMADLIAPSGQAVLAWTFPALWLAYGLTRQWVGRRYR